VKGKDILKARRGNYAFSKLAAVGKETGYFAECVIEKEAFLLQKGRGS